MIVNVANLAMLFQAYHAAFKKGFASFGISTVWQKIATKVPSTTLENDYSWLGHFPGLREWVGDRQVKNMTMYDYSLKNKDFEATVEVPRNRISDDQYGVFTPMMESMGDSAARHPDELLFALILLGASTLCYDGQFFFDTDHPVGAGTVSNYDATGGGNMWVLLDTRRPLKPFIYQLREMYKFDALTKRDDENVFWRKTFVYGVDGRANVGFGFWQQAYASLNTLNATNFDAAIAAMMTYESDEGKKLGIMPNLLICGPSNRAAAKALLEREQLAGSGTNTNYKAVDLLVTPYMV